MKLFYSLLLLMTLPLLLEAQAFAIRHDRLNIVYVGIDNPITIVSGSCGCDKLSATVDQGTLTKKEGCSFIYRGQKAGRATITITQKTGGRAKVIGTQELRVKNVPGPSVSVGFQYGGYYDLQRFKAQAGLVIKTDGSELDETYRVVSFRCITIGQDGVSQSTDVEGPYFNASCKAAIARLVAGDRVIIENIKVAGSDQVTRNINALTYTMK